MMRMKWRQQLSLPVMSRLDEMIEGDLSPWADSFPARLIPKVMDLLLESWPALAHPTLNEHETSITRRFRKLLRQQRTARLLPFSIERELPIDDEATAEEVGRLDLRFLHGFREEVYLSFEGKRLNVVGTDGTVQRRTSEYISEGMMRYVSGQYATGLLEGGMLAYVMDGDGQGAIDALGTLVAKRCDELCVATATGLEASELRPSDAVRQTRHQLAERVIRLHHVVLRIAA